MKAFGQPFGSRLRDIGSLPEQDLRGRETIGLQFRGLSFAVLPDENEVAVIRDEHLAVLTPVAGYLFTVSNYPGILPGMVYSHAAKAIEIEDIDARLSALEGATAEGNRQ